jgi:hypothetical protein
MATKKKADKKAESESETEGDAENNHEDREENKSLEPKPREVKRGGYEPNPWDHGPGRARTDL